MAHKTKPQPLPSPSVGTELRLAKHYWLDTIQPYIAGRRLRDVELFVANYAHRNLQGAARKAAEWNATDPGKLLPVPADAIAELSNDKFRKPVPLFAEETLKPEMLASIAAGLLPRRDTERTPLETLHVAHELLFAAQQYIEKLPKRLSGIESLSMDLDLCFSTVTFDDILRSNKKDSGCLPLVPTKQRARHKGELSLRALKTAVMSFWEQEKKNRPQITEEQWNREMEQNQRLAQEGKLVMIGSGKPITYQEWESQPDETIKECLQYNRITLQSLCEMRWLRFKSFWEDQQERSIRKQGKLGKQHRSKT